MITIFLSYAHADEAYRRELEKHLASLRREGFIAPWHDRKIVPGADIGREIDANLERADIILLLVSPDFIDSDYCYDIEMKRAVGRHRDGSARVIPVIVRPCDWHSAPFGRLKALPKDGTPISTYSNPDEAFLEVAQAIRALAGSVKSGASQETGRGRAPRPRAKGRPERPSPGSRPTRADSPVRIKRQFTDRDKDGFLEEAFESIARSFKTSLSALVRENRHVEAKFKRVDAEHFSAIAYVQGEVRSYCRVWVGGRGSFTSGIAYSSNESGGDNAFNEALSVEDDGYRLLLRPLGMGSHGSHDPMSAEDAGRYLWGVFLKPLR